MTHTRMLQRTLIGGAILVLSGCTTFSENGGFDVAEQTAANHLEQEPVWLRDDAAREEAAAEVARLLEAELTAGSAVQIAFLNNPGLQAAYAELGMSEADLVQAGRLPNPGFSYENTSGGGAQEIDRGIEFGILSILTMPFRVAIEERRFEAAKLRAAGDTIDVAMETRKAYFNAVAARQALDYMRQVVEAAEASRDLMARMKRVGNASRMELAREQLFLSESTSAYAQATRAQLGARESLIRAWGSGVRSSTSSSLTDCQTYLTPLLS